MTPLAAAILILGIVDKGLALRLEQYKVSPDLVKVDAASGEQLAKLGLAVLVSIGKIGEAIEDGFEDLLNPTPAEKKAAAKKAAAKKRKAPK